MQPDHGATTMTRRATDSETAPATGSRDRSNKALDAFLAAKIEIDAMLERLAALSADHFETSPDEIHWGHVGTLKHYAGLLRQITDSAFKEGEHAA